MTGDEVDALLRLPFFMPEHVGTAEQPRGEARHGAVVTFQKAAHIVAESSVPLLPGVANEVAYLVEAGSIPRLGDQLRSGEERVGFDVPQDRWVGHWPAVLVTRQDRREIEAEPVDVHLGHPVAQAVLDQPAHDWLIRVERI